MKKYAWALNEQKLARAVGEAAKEFGGKETESDIKYIYTRMGGLVALSDVIENENMSESETAAQAAAETVQEAPVEEMKADAEAIQEASVEEAAAPVETTETGTDAE